jgi:hypothetical protein
MSKMTELQKKLYDKIILAANYIQGKQKKQSMVKLDKDKIYERWKPIVEKMGITDTEKQTLLCKYAQMHKENEGKNVMPFSGDASEHAKQPYDFQNILLPTSMKVYAQVHDKELLGVLNGSYKKDEDKDEIK